MGRADAHHALGQLRVLHEREQRAAARRRAGAEPHVAGAGVVVAGAVVDDPEAHDVAIERDRRLEVAADRGDVVQPAELHAALFAHSRQPTSAERQSARAAAEGDAEHQNAAAKDRRPRRPPPRARGRRTARPPRAPRAARPAPTSASGSRRSARAAPCRARPARRARARTAAPGARRPCRPGDEAEHDQHEPDEHADLDERERVPGRLRALVGRGAGGRGDRRLGRAAAPRGGPAAPAHQW